MVSRTAFAAQVGAVAKPPVARETLGRIVPLPSRIARERGLFVIEDHAIRPFRVHGRMERDALVRHAMSPEPFILVELSRDEAERHEDRKSTPVRLARVFSQREDGTWERGYHPGASAWYLKATATAAGRMDQLVEDPLSGSSR